METYTSVFLPSCSSSARLPDVLTQGSVAFPRDPTGLSHVPPLCDLKFRVTFEAGHGNQAHLEWTETFGGLLEWWHQPWSSSRLSC